jgi:hypothetical protein
MNSIFAPGGPLFPGPDPEFDSGREFDCADCGRHVFSIGGPSDQVRCAICEVLPGWFRDLEIRSYFEPDPDWQPPVSGSA